MDERELERLVGESLTKLGLEQLPPPRRSPEAPRVTFMDLIRKAPALCPRPRLQYTRTHRHIHAPGQPPRSNSTAVTNLLATSTSGSAAPSTSTPATSSGDPSTHAFGGGGGGGVCRKSFKAKAEAKPKQSKIHKTRRQAGGLVLYERMLFNCILCYLHIEKVILNIYLEIEFLKLSPHMYTKNQQQRRIFSNVDRGWRIAARPWWTSCHSLAPSSLARNMQDIDFDKI